MNNIRHLRNALQHNERPIALTQEELASHFANTRVTPTEAQIRTGRTAPLQRQTRTTFPQAEEIDGWKPQEYPKRPEITLESIKSDLATVYAELTSTQAHYEANNDVVDTREADKAREILQLEQQLSKARAELDAIKAEGTVQQQVTRALAKAERATSALASNTVDAGAAADSLATFKVAIKHVEEATKKLASDQSHLAASVVNC